MLYIDIYLLLYLTKLSIFYGLSPSFLTGVGAQISPARASLLHRFRGEGVLIFTPTLENGVNHNPDFTDYKEPFTLYDQCLAAKAKKKLSLPEKQSPCLSIKRSCLCIFPLSYRLPGYGIWVYAWGLNKSPEEEYLYLLLLHTFWASLAALAFGDLVRGVTGSALMGGVSMLIYAFFPFTLRYEWIPGSDSMNYSFITLFIWSFWRSQWKHHGWLFLSGLLLLKATLIRPITFAIFLPATGFLFLKREKVLQHLLAFLLPLLAFQAYWQTCNLAVHGKVYLLSKTLFYSGIERSEWGAAAFLLGSFGDNYYWFYSPRYKFPERAFTSEFGPPAERTIDSIYRGYFAGQITEAQAAAYANAWRESIRKEKKLLYYVWSRFYAALNFFTCHLQENFYYTDALRAGAAYMVIYSISSILWVMGVGVGLVGSVYYLCHWKRYPFLAFLAVSSGAAWGSYVLLLQIQSRYFLFPMAFLLPLSIVFFWEKVLKRPVQGD